MGRARRILAWPKQTKYILLCLSMYEIRLNIKYTIFPAALVALYTTPSEWVKKVTAFNFCFVPQPNKYQYWHFCWSFNFLWSFISSSCPIYMVPSQLENLTKWTDPLDLCHLFIWSQCNLINKLFWTFECTTHKQSKSESIWSVERRYGRRFCRSKLLYLHIWIFN